MSKFVDCDRDRAFLLPPDLCDWIPEDDLAHFVIEAVERVDLGAFKVNHRGTGSAQFHPRMMLALPIYCYAIGIFSSRRIERATQRDLDILPVYAGDRAAREVGQKLLPQITPVHIHGAGMVRAWCGHGAGFPDLFVTLEHGLEERFAGFAGRVLDLPDRGKRRGIADNLPDPFPLMPDVH